ncbi:hypothetical protein QTP86_014769, partial [Hemibagrus guttatus]
LPNYNSTTKNNDIALLHLDASVNFTDHIRPVCLAGQGSSFPDGTIGWITGWGNVNATVSSPGVLQEAMVPIADAYLCDFLLSPGSITANMICAGYIQGGLTPARCANPSPLSGRVFGPVEPEEERGTQRGNMGGSEEQGKAGGGSEEHGEVSGGNEEQGEASGGSDGHGGKARGSQTASTAEQKCRVTSTAEQEGQATSIAEQQSRAMSTAEQQSRATSPDA